MLEHVKSYLRIDGAEDDILLQSLTSAAQQYVKNGTGIEFVEEPKPTTGAYELYRIAILMLVTHWFENREPIGQAVALAYSMESIFLQLKYCHETEVTT